MFTTQLIKANKLPSFAVPGDQIFAGPLGPGLHCNLAGTIDLLTDGFENALEQVWYTRWRVMHP